MPFTVTMPKLSPTMEEGTIAKWHCKEGDKVSAGAVLLEITTDKATVEHTALDEGFLRKILVPEGETVSVNEPIAIFSETADEPIEEAKKEEKPKEEKPPEEKVKEEEQKEEEQKRETSFKQPSFIPFPPLKKYDFNFPTSQAERVKATPLAKKIAEEKGLDLSSVKGSGPAGRVTSKDLDLSQEISVVSFSRRKMPTMQPGSYLEEPLTPMRKAIGARLQQSKTFIPHYYISKEICMDLLVKTREQLKNLGIKLTFNDFVIKACALALKKHPNINSGFNSETQSVIHFKTVDIALAVTIEGGLITPIIRHADFKNVKEISVEVKSLAKKAKEQKLKLEEFQGGSFTISNLGMFGIDSFIAVINPPQSAILAVGGVEKKPVVKDDEIVISNRMNLTLSLDHRVIDGADGAQFIKTIQMFLENPSSLLL